MARWNGDEHRWHRWSAPSFSQPSISVIEPAEKRSEDRQGRRVPFGFSRVLAPEPVVTEPLTWEGSD